MSLNKMMLKHHYNKHYPQKATKYEVLKFIKEREIIVAMDLVEHFGYKLESAIRTLYRLAKQGLVTQWVFPEKWCLTQEGERRLKYYAEKEKTDE